MLVWLSFMPSLENVARALVLDYFAPLNASQATIWALDKKDSLTCLAVFGNSETVVGVPIPGSRWRRDDETSELAAQASSRQSPKWSDENRLVVANLYSQSLLVGFITLNFSEPVTEPKVLSPKIELFCSLISLYITLRFPCSLDQGSSKSGAANVEPRLTNRQQSVLNGIAQKKTNSIIAKELGYSVSTIRHETMRIFEALGVSDRVEAAAHANKFRMV